MPEVVEIEVELRSEEVLHVEIIGRGSLGDRLLLVGREVELSRHRDPGLRGENLTLGGRESRDDVGNLGPRADQRHVALQEIEELRKLVELRLAEPRADSCDTRVALSGDAGS